MESKGNKEIAANKLGIDLATLYRKLKKLKIETA
jgi:transcriptional regulator of acetoin/glycerol metabolism